MNDRDCAEGYIITAANEGRAYEGLRVLWCEVFGDEPEYVDAMYANFGSDIHGYAVVDPDGEVCSALTCYRCGTYENRPVYVSYAICTREDMRGHGLGAMLTAFVRDEVITAGGISIVSPAEPSLEEFYARLGYEPWFMAAERAVMSPEFDEEEYDDFDEFDMDFGDEDDGGTFAPEMDIEPLSAERYNRYREAFLSVQPHVELSEAMMRLVEAETAGSCGLYSINRGDAICAVSEAGPARLVLAELVLNPVLKELSLDIDGEIASMLAEHFGAAETIYRMPGAGRCQSMAAGLSHEYDNDNNEDEEAYEYGEPYFGFPVD